MNYSTWVTSRLFVRGAGTYFAPAALALCAAAACTPNFKSQSFVDKFRILAIKADPPAGPPGDEVTLTPLLSEPRLGGLPILIWMTCSPLPGQSGMQCLEGGGAGEVSFGETLTLTLPELGPDEEEKTVDVILLACAGVPRMPDFEKGDYAFCDSPESDLALRSVTVTREPPNLPPVIEALRFTCETTGDVELPEAQPAAVDCGADCGPCSFTVTLTPESVEFYEIERFGEIKQMRENTFISWFATGGTFEDARTYESRYTDLDGTREELTYDVTWKPPAETGDVTFYIVAYDGRAGVDFWTREARFAVEGP
jgi:hypothetical protein